MNRYLLFIAIIWLGIILFCVGIARIKEQSVSQNIKDVIFYWELSGIGLILSGLLIFAAGVFLLFKG